MEHGLSIWICHLFGANRPQQDIVHAAPGSLWIREKLHPRGFGLGRALPSAKPDVPERIDLGPEAGWEVRLSRLVVVQIDDAAVPGNVAGRVQEWGDFGRQRSTIRFLAIRKAQWQQSRVRLHVRGR